MISISLTDFIDYVSKVGASKYTKVNEVFAREEYNPAFDFWKPLRDGIIDIHENKKDKSELNKILEGLTDKKKILRYPDLIESYKSFLGRKKYEWFEPPYKDWQTGDLRIRLNPELGLEIKGIQYVIKLYFKSEKLSQGKADLILLLMNTKLKRGYYKDVTFSILDIERNKLFEKTRLDNNHIALLEGEALSFMNIWHSFEN